VVTLPSTSADDDDDDDAAAPSFFVSPQHNNNTLDMITPDLITRAENEPTTGDPTRDNWLARVVRVHRDTLAPIDRAAFDAELIDRTAAMCSLGNECQRTLAPHGRTLQELEDWFWRHEGGGVLRGATPDGPFSFTVPEHLAESFIALQGVFAAGCLIRRHLALDLREAGLNDAAAQLRADAAAASIDSPNTTT
jgi:hypothetical protein